MDIISSHDIVGWTIEDAIERDNGAWSLCAEKKALINNMCDLVDLLCREYDAGAINAQVDENCILHIGYKCDDMIVDGGQDHPFFQLLSIVDSVSFYADGEELAVQFSLKVTED